LTIPSQETGENDYFQALKTRRAAIAKKNPDAKEAGVKNPCIDDFCAAVGRAGG